MLALWEYFWDWGGAPASPVFFADAEPSIYLRVTATPSIQPRVDGDVSIDTEDV